MRLSDEQFNSLSQWESYFRTAVEEHWSRYPGQNALNFILSIWNDVSNVTRRVNMSCQRCVYDLLVDMGTIYFQDKRERESKPKRTRRK